MITIPPDRKQSPTESALSLVLREMERQDTLWGEARHDEDDTWIVGIMEEIGEMCRASNDTHPAKGHDIKTEAIQAAALLCQFIKDLESQRR